MVGLPSSGPVGLEGAQWEAERGSRQPCHPATILQYLVYYPTMPSYYAQPSILSYYAKSTILLCHLSPGPSQVYILYHPMSTCQ